MRSPRTVAALAVLLLLAGCYASTTPLISAAQAVFPYQKITYWQSGDSSMTTLIRQGDAYVTTGQTETDALRFMPVGNGYYVAQIQMQTDRGPSFLYGLVRLDLAAKTASTYATTAGKADFGPGLVPCPDSDDTVCLTDLRPYIDHAMALAAGNGPADAVYNIDLVQ